VDRGKRKLDHIKYAISTGQLGDNGLEDVSFIHNSIPLTALDQINIDTKIGELQLRSPIFINAMTGGGGRKTYEINKSLAEVAKHFNLAISVGSQTAALRDSSERATFEVVRQVNQNGVVFGNVGSDVSVDDAKRAVDMIEANALQIHVNVVQELVMPEGDRDFSNVLRNIERIARAVDSPIIVKEVGFGMSRETASMLKGIGIKLIDVGGFGGTNFSKVENERRNNQLPFFDQWGIPTSISLVEVGSEKEGSYNIIASGGINNGLHVAKAIALGADAVAFAGYFLNILVSEGEDALFKELEVIHNHLMLIMTALGANSIETLQGVPVLFSGNTLNWLTQRGLNVQSYSQRTRNQ
jgi:isopentenyl-diphosphate delta-isomerase